MTLMPRFRLPLPIVIPTPIVIVIVILLVLVAPFSSLPARAQATSQPQPQAQSASAQTSLTPNVNLYTSIDSLDDKQKLNAGDHVSFRVIEDKDDPKSLVVTDAGELDIPYLGRVKASDKTCQGLAREVQTLLEKELYYKATVILAIDQLNKKRGSVYLVGQVRASGPVEIPSDEIFTVSKAIMRAGGFGDFADKKHVKVTRKPAAGAGPNQIILVDVSEILEKGRTDNDARLEPGDLIFVPSRLVNF